MISQRQLFLGHLGQTSDFPLLLEFTHAKGVHMYDREGKEYIDLISGIGVSSVGHAHPEVLQAIKDQTEQHLHLMVYGEFVQSSQVALASKLATTLPEQLTHSFLVNSGSEANEGAIKLARRFTARKGIISCINAYHGSTTGALAITGGEELQAPFTPLLPGVEHIQFNDVDGLNKITSDTAAFIMEPVQGEAGVVPATQEFIAAARARCNEVGALLIFDEVQSGAGRTGEFWAFEHYSVAPDILTCAKGIGGGMPIGAFIASEEIMSVLKTNPILGHITTFGGHPVSAAAANAAVNYLLRDRPFDSVPEKAALFKSLLQHEAIKEIRNLGLMMAIEFESFDVLKPIIDRAIELGVVTDWFLFNDKSMRIAPPLPISEEEIKLSCELILQAITDIVG